MIYSIVRMHCLLMLATYPFTGKDTVFYKKYEVAQATVYYNYFGRFSLSQARMTLQFNDFGDKERLTLETTISDSIQKQTSLLLGQWRYQFFDTLQCIKTPRPTKFGIDNIDVSLLKSKTVEGDEIEFKKSEDTILGKLCDGFVFKGKKKGLIIHVLAWQNIPLSIEVSENGIHTKVQAYSLDLVTKIDSVCFELPKGIEIISVSSRANY